MKALAYAVGLESLALVHWIKRYQSSAYQYKKYHEDEMKVQDFLQTVDVSLLRA